MLIATPVRCCNLAASAIAAGIDVMGRPNGNGLLRI
jgi:hypothetical protein